MFEKTNKDFQLLSNKNYNHSNETEKKINHKSAPKTIRLLLAQLINSFIEYTSELTYFSINTFQTSSLRRVQTTTLTRFDHYCIPRPCAFYYSLDREFDEFIQRMKKLCKRTQTTFLDIRSARIHYPQSSMFNMPDTHRSLEILKCNIERLRDLKEIHQDLGHDLLLPSDQLFLSLDLLVTDFQLILCELDNRVCFQHAMILQTFVKDIFLQYRVVLTWLYPAIKMAAYRIGDPNKEHAVKHCNKIEKPKKKISRPNLINQELNRANQDLLLNNLPLNKTTEARSQSALQHDRFDEITSSVISNCYINDFEEEKKSINRTTQDLQPSVNENKQSCTSPCATYSTSLSFIKQSIVSNKNDEVTDHHLLSDKDNSWYREKIDEIQQNFEMNSVRIFVSYINEK